MEEVFQPSQSGFPEFNEHRIPQTSVEAGRGESREEQMLLDYLLATGFELDEAEKLIEMRDHLYTNPEMRQRIAGDYRMHFARWLYEQGELSEQETESEA
jgi:lysine/ornithine N-monooxygenase